MAPDPDRAPSVPRGIDETPYQPQQQTVPTTGDGWKVGDVAVRAAGDMVQVHTRFHDQWWSEGGRTASDTEVGDWAATGEAIVVRVQPDDGTVVAVVVEHAVHAPNLDCCLHKSAEAIRWHCPGCDWTASDSFTSPERRVEMFTDRHGYPPPTDPLVDHDPVREALAHTGRSTR